MGILIVKNVGGKRFDTIGYAYNGLHKALFYSRSNASWYIFNSTYNDRLATSGCL